MLMVPPGLMGHQVPSSEAVPGEVPPGTKGLPGELAARAGKPLWAEAQRTWQMVGQGLPTTRPTPGHWATGLNQIDKDILMPQNKRSIQNSFLGPKDCFALKYFLK